jgi:peptidoglycan/LPS O-acetylase OafA/YrhL
MPAPAEPGRVTGVDGIRGLAALYVLVHHCWLLTFHGYPANHGPGWLGWLLYGHLGVVLFITLSGFSLALSPARHGWDLGGVGRFARRRAWRILPPYWAALALSLVIAWLVVPQPHSAPPTGRSVVVYGLLLQDLTTAPVPNGAFWSIAVEVELYLVLPLLLLVRRRVGAVAMIAAVVVPVVCFGLANPGLSTVDRATGLAPQFAPLFAMGVLAAGTVAASDRVRALPWPWLAGLCAAPVVLLMVREGSVWTVDHYYWIDLAVGPALAMLLAGVATGRPAALVRLLATRPVHGLGTFSYSLYLIHVPVVVVVSRELVAPYVPPGLPAFGVTLAVAVPVALVAARLFASVFEIPFQRYRGAAPIRLAVRRALLLAAPLAQLAKRLREDRRALGVGAALLHIREVALVRLGARLARWVLLVASGRQATARALPRGRGGRVGREQRLDAVAVGTPVGDSSYGDRLTAFVGTDRP